jgi:hypothetical protein
MPMQPHLARAPSKSAGLGYPILVDFRPILLDVAPNVFPLSIKINSKYPCGPVGIAKLIALGA